MLLFAAHTLLIQVWAGHVELKMGRDGGGERRPTTRCVHEAVGRYYSLLSTMNESHAEGPSHTTFHKPFDDQPLEERRQERFQSFELGAEERVSAAAVGYPYHTTIRRPSAPEGRVVTIQPQQDTSQVAHGPQQRHFQESHLRARQCRIAARERQLPQ